MTETITIKTHPCECGVALVVAIYSAIKRSSVLPGLLVLGDLGTQGNIKSMRSPMVSLQIDVENGARRALIPPENNATSLKSQGESLANGGICGPFELRQRVFEGGRLQDGNAKEAS